MGDLQQLERRMPTFYGDVWLAKERSGYLHVELWTAIKRRAGLLKRLVAIYMFGYSQRWEPASTDMGG
jgi:hypothetical protein